MAVRSGEKVANQLGDRLYYSFKPAPLPPNPPVKLDEKLIDWLIKANRQLAILNFQARSIPSVKLFISMFVRKEALMSSQIEGTQATLEDLFDPRQSHHNEDLAEVVNYVRSLEHALDLLQELPLCNRLIRESHKILMEGVRGKDKRPGQFRDSQNWIGGQGSDLNTASYIPPNVADMEKAMADLEHFFHRDDPLDPLIDAALIHYQFETIHPFMDGNGRLGRLLVVLYLIEKGILTSPVLYISYYLKLNRIEYYDRLGAVREKGDYEGWVEFFLRAVDAAASDALDSIEKLGRLHEKNLKKIEDRGRGAANTLKVFFLLESEPMLEIGKAAKKLGLAFNTAASALDRLLELGIVELLHQGKRNRIFIYHEYLDLLKAGTLL